MKFFFLTKHLQIYIMVKNYENRSLEVIVMIIYAKTKIPKKLLNWTNHCAGLSLAWFFFFALFDNGGFIKKIIILDWGFIKFTHWVKKAVSQKWKPAGNHKES